MSAALEILIVDDDELVCQRIEALLAAHGLSAISVNTLQLAREAMRAIYFPLVILDRQLEDGDGSDLCREYRARQSDKRVRILMLSNSDSPEEEAFALASGADDFVSKKSSDEVLTARVVQLYAIACGRKVKNIDSTAEQSRLRALHDLGVLKSEPDDAFEDIVRLARAIFRTPISLITFVDAHHVVWFKSERGFVASKVPREQTFCAHTIERPNELLVVPDATSDARFAKNPLVTGEPHIRFYAGAPLVIDGQAVGTVCIIDTIPRMLDADSTKSLRALARQVVFLLEQRQRKQELERTLVAHRAADADLRRSEALFREAFESSSIGKALVSMEGQWLRVNRAVCDILGYPEADLLATTFQTITHADDLETDLSHVRDMLDGKIRSYEMEKRYIHKRGHIVWALLSVSLVRDEADRPLFFVSQIQDISARKRLERTKGEFLTMLSHELRIPVTAAKGTLGLLTAGVGGELTTKARELAQRAHQDIDKVQRLIDDILAGGR